MPGKKKLPVPDNQLTLLPMEPELPKPVPPKKEKESHEEVPGHADNSGVKRIASLEERVTRLEGEVALTRGQLERDELDDDD